MVIIILPRCHCVSLCLHVSAMIHYIVCLSAVLYLFWNVVRLFLVLTDPLKVLKWCPPPPPPTKKKKKKKFLYLWLQKQDVSGPISLQSIPFGALQLTNNRFFILWGIIFFLYSSYSFGVNSWPPSSSPTILFVWQRNERHFWHKSII